MCYFSDPVYVWNQVDQQPHQMAIESKIVISKLN